MNDHGSFELDISQRKVGPIWLSPGVRPVHVWTLFYTGAMTIAFINVLNLLNPYILREHLGMATSGHGDFTGNVYVATELVTMLLAVFIGVSSDRVGRRPVFVTGFLIITIGMLIMPMIETPWAYTVLRLCMSAGIGMCTTMVGSLCADYPQNAHRGKFISANGLASGLGIILVASFGISQLPQFLVGRGATSVQAGDYTFWITGTLAFVTALVARLGLRPGRVLQAENDAGRPVGELARIGFAEIRKNSRLVLGCGATFLSRGDLTVLATFFSLWLMALGADNSMETAAAQGITGRLFGLSQVAMLLSLPFIGMLVDRLDRVTGLCIAMALAAAGYFALGLVGDPFNSPMIYPAVLSMGVGEAAMIVSVPAMIHQEAPLQMRGSIIGVMAAFGGLGIVLNIKIAGLLFDGFSYQAPFLWMGIVNVAMLVWAVIVRLRTGRTHHGITRPVHS